MNTRERARPLAPEERRQAILDAVIPLLEPGTGALTTKRIAEAAGIAEGTIFRVFPDKKIFFYALAEQVSTLDRDELTEALDGIDDLRSKLVITVGQMLERTEKMLTVMHSLRVAMGGEVLSDHKPGDGRAPEFLVRVNRQLRDNLTGLLFEPHREELTISPEAAATALQGMIFGIAHPGMIPTIQLTPDDIANILLDGVRGGSPA